MPKAYHHPHLDERVKGIGVLDAMVRLPEGTCYHVLSVTVGTDGQGLAMLVITVDRIGPTGESLGCVPMGAYPIEDRDHCLRDALRLARHWGLSLRCCSSRVGWMDVDTEDGDQLSSSLDLDFKV